MSDLVPFIIGLGPFLLPLIFLAFASVISRIMESRHDEDLDKREAQVLGFAVSDLDYIPAAPTPNHGQLVTGTVVMGTGNRRQFTASFRSFFGGEIKGYQSVMLRARREAQLRMVETAIAQGAEAIVNVRFETSSVGGTKPINEVFCYGTMVKA